MKWNSTSRTALIKIESLLLRLFKEEPFHNLYHLYGKKPLTTKYGGTCTDKTLSFIHEARSLGFNAQLHTGYIQGEEIHRLARVTINNRIFFADPGNGWPSLKLYPADEKICFPCFGMFYRTEITNNKISVFHTRNNKEFLQLEINPIPRPDIEIKENINNRFNSDISYPFKGKLRFSLVVDNQFLFLRDERLEIYSESEFSLIEGIKRELLPKILRERFRYESALLLKYLTDDSLNIK
ncbi:hypothetical protein D5R81_19485 [Parashewanella spongiae]|uniref:Uncharacterized protein n=1 Tax=Parashewanella spongiae TaxID=342950 RepID=A0A3A6TAP6_9GAMM|nr:arylamine N-acetyltransferase [Parashewanella spongiae]MCL1080196.1 arylamine N-acetyltransferase [Parashewanella spongiae]RJY02158.1 hypothetical protein D5R81_19485 [Parashewanella spongiae]